MTSFETAMRSWVSGGKPTFGPSRPHSFILLRALCYADFRPDPRGFGLFSLLRNCEILQTRNRRTVAATDWRSQILEVSPIWSGPESRSIFFCELDLELE